MKTPQTAIAAAAVKNSSFFVLLDVPGVLSRGGDGRLEPLVCFDDPPSILWYIAFSLSSETRFFFFRTANSSRAFCEQIDNQSYCFYFTQIGVSAKQEKNWACEKRAKERTKKCKCSKFFRPDSKFGVGRARLHGFSLAKPIANQSTARLPLWRQAGSRVTLFTRSC